MDLRACFWPPHPNKKKSKNKQEGENQALLMACRTYIPNPVSEWWFVNESAFPSIHLFVSKQAVTHRAGTSCLPVPLTSSFGEPPVLSARSSPQDKHWHGQLQSYGKVYPELSFTRLPCCPPRLCVQIRRLLPGPNIPTQKEKKGQKDRKKGAAGR